MADTALWADLAQAKADRTRALRTDSTAGGGPGEKFRVGDDGDGGGVGEGPRTSGRSR